MQASLFSNEINQTNRNINPCTGCNANGDVYGEKHFQAWNNFYKL